MSRGQVFRSSTPGGLGFGGPVPKDLWVLLGLLFATFVLSSFDSTRLLPSLLALSPAAWRLGMVWQLVTYPFVGHGGGVFFLIELLFLFLFSRDIFLTLGRRRFWRFLLTGAIVAGIAAVLVDMLVALLAPGSNLGAASFSLMQGQRMLICLCLAAFGTLFGEATILLFFVLPIRARLFLWIEIAIAFVAFLGSKDLAGFVGIVIAVGFAFAWLSPGGLQSLIRNWRLRFEKARIERQIKGLRSSRPSRGNGNGSPSDDDNVRQGPWVN